MWASLLHHNKLELIIREIFGLFIAILSLFYSLSHMDLVYVLILVTWLPTDFEIDRKKSDTFFVRRFTWMSIVLWGIGLVSQILSIVSLLLLFKVNPLGMSWWLVFLLMQVTILFSWYYARFYQCLNDRFVPMKTIEQLISQLEKSHIDIEIYEIIDVLGAVGNADKDRTVEALQPWLNNPSERVRSHAIASLEKLNAHETLSGT